MLTSRRIKTRNSGFEDGNGRIDRDLAEMVLLKELGGPIVFAISKSLEKRKKEYYAALEKCTRTLDARPWVEFFAQVVLQAHENSMRQILFLVEKSKLLSLLSGHINARQTKVLHRMFLEGVEGFKGGLSAENYLAITKTTWSTATRDLSDLVDKGALKKSGKLRHTRYRLNVAPTD